MKFYFLVFYISLGITLNAQIDTVETSKTHSSHNLLPELPIGKDGAKSHVLDAKDSTYNVVFVKDELIYEWKHSKQFLGQELPAMTLFHYKKTHRIIKVLNDKGVDDFNKIYIPLGTAEELIDFHAKIKKRDGTVLEMDTSHVKTLDDLEGYGRYLLVAFEGVEIGSEIEYYFTKKSMENGYYGTIWVQNNYPKHDFSFHIYSPYGYEFLAKYYNGGYSMTVDTSSVKRNHIYLSNVNVPAFQDEPYSAGESLKHRIEYKLSKKEEERGEFYTWEYAANWYAHWIYEPVDKKRKKKQDKAIARILKKAKVSRELSRLEQVVRLENYMKRNFELDDYSGNFYIDEILQNKVWTQKGAIRAFSLILRKLGIDNQIILTCDRFKKKFDGDFESYAFLDDVLLYIPKLNNYVYPGSMNHRTGVEPYQFAGQDALFVKIMSIGGRISAFPQVKTLPSLALAENGTFDHVEVNFGTALNSVNIDYKKELYGIEAVDTKAELMYLSEQDREFFLKGFFDGISEELEVINVEASKADLEGYQNQKKLLISGVLKVNSLLVKAGDKLIFEVGKLIGDQEDLYKEQQRINPVVGRYAASYNRKIKVAIPAGYQLKNIEELNMDVEERIDSSSTMKFVVTAEVVNGVLMIKIEQSYQGIDFPAIHYKLFRRVINAAADFNKKVLILEKEN